jgi:5-methylcytosine-specific restriction endonuclease McrA
MAYRPPQNLGRHVVAATPVTSAVTPHAPTVHVGAAHLISHSSSEYDRLRHRAVANNVARMDVRPADPHAWRKSALTEEEKYYLWQSQRGCCANASCRTTLDLRTMTIEHIVPKSEAAGLTWDIRNMTVLCHSCNSRKGDRAAPFPYAAMTMADPRAVRYAERK